MKRSLQTAFKWMLGVALLAITVGLPAGAWGEPVGATGGDYFYEVEDGGTPYLVHVFTNTGPATLTILNGGLVDVLVVGGGGGGGGGAMAGGGGGGGVIAILQTNMTSGVYTLTVGLGGLGGYAYNLPGQTGVRGENSTFGGQFVAVGGGGGCGWAGHPSTSGGSGGGGNSALAASPGTPGQGHAGAIGSNTSGKRSGGGGGGAGEPGGLGEAGVGGKGGDGREVFGSYYGGGGGGGLEGTQLAGGGGVGGLGGGGTGSRGSTNAMHATPSTGGGGGGAGHTSSGTGRLGGNGGTGIVMIRYVADPVRLVTDVTLADAVTGSTRFTNTNAVRVTALPTYHGYDGYDQFQYTGESNLVSALDTEGWASTNVLLGYDATFARPMVDTNLSLYVWFTNATGTAGTLLRSKGEIFYTSETPVAAVRSTLTRAQLPGTNAIVTVEDLDIGSSAGVANGINMAMYARKVVAINPEDDLTPEATYVTLPRLVGDYPLQLWLQNEAGSAITSATTCMVTVVDSVSTTNTWTGAGLTELWSDGVNWSAGLPVDGQDVAIARADAVVKLEGGPTAELASFKITSGSLIFSDWSSQLNATNVIISGGAVTCASDFDESGPSNRVWIVCEESFYLVKPGAIDVSGKGYTNESGPGIGVTTAHGTGGGHGGQGGFGYKRGGATYGSLTAPVTPGSGGTPYLNTVGSFGGSGGGVVRIIAGDTVSIKGEINANGLKPSTSGGGGAGGSIYITAAQFTGNADGLLVAKGAAANNTGSGGGGGGGRIAVDGGDVAAPLAVRFSTAPGRGDNDAEDTGIPASIRPLEPHQAWTAGWGTLYIEDESLLLAMPQNNQFDRVVLRVGNATAWNISQLTVTNNSFRLIPEGFQLNVAGDLKVGVNAHLGVVGSIACGGNLILTNGARLSVFSGPAGASIYGAFVDVTNDIVISEGAWLQPNSHTTDGGSVRLRMRNLRIIGTTGGINAMARGYAPRQGEGMGGGTGYYGGGGGYGGVGGKGSYGVGGKVCGNPYAPRAPGSGGGGSYDGAPLFTGSGYGGGLVSVEAAKDVMINGQIIANGGIGTGHYLYGAGGAGGGIFISCDRFLGTETALLSAKGGDSSTAGGGGGGRIAVWHNSMPLRLRDKLVSGDLGTAIASTNNPASYLGQVNVGVGTGGTPAAQPGTVWFIMPPPPGTMILLR